MDKDEFIKDFVERQVNITNMLISHSERMIQEDREKTINRDKCDMWKSIAISISVAIVCSIFLIGYFFSGYEISNNINTNNTYKASE